jgi:hypothetical protein
MTTTTSGRRVATDHFKRLVEEACPNHWYPVRHKLKDYVMMRSFMTSGSLTWGAELDEDLGGSDTTPFPGENTFMMVYGGAVKDEGGNQGGGVNRSWIKFLSQENDLCPTFKTRNKNPWNKVMKKH